MTLIEVLTLISSVAAAGSAVAAAIGLWHLSRQLSVGEKATEAMVFLRIYDGWDSVYPAYRKLLDNPFDLTAIMKSYTARTYMGTDEWREKRSVFAFYEFLGSCVEAGLLKDKTLFSLVTVNPELWAKYEPLILWLRTGTQRRDLYESWEALDKRKREHIRKAV